MGFPSQKKGVLAKRGETGAPLPEVPFGIGRSIVTASMRRALEGQAPGQRQPIVLMLGQRPAVHGASGASVVVAGGPSKGWQGEAAASLGGVGRYPDWPRAPQPVAPSTCVR